MEREIQIEQVDLWSLVIEGEYEGGVKNTKKNLMMNIKIETKSVSHKQIVCVSIKWNL